MTWTQSKIRHIGRWYPTRNYLARPRTRASYRSANRGATNAATRIQALLRGRLARKRTNPRIRNRRNTTRAFGGRMPDDLIRRINRYL